MEITKYLKSKKCPIINSFVAKKMYGETNYSVTKFHNKLHGVQNRGFSDDEKKKIISILLSIGEEFKGLHL